MYVQGACILAACFCRIPLDVVPQHHRPAQQPQRTPSPRVFLCIFWAKAVRTGGKTRDLVPGNCTCQ
eukprot:7243846-Prorocentrum_lima.AAC.1